jgi:hypothetical protein
MDSECLLPFGVGCARLLLVRPDPTRPRSYESGGATDG